MTEFAIDHDARPIAQADIVGWCEQLLAHGYVIIPDAIGCEDVRLLERDLADRFDKTPFCEGRFYGPRTKRFHKLLTRSPHAVRFVQHELVLAIVNEVLRPYCDFVQLNLTQALEVHPGAPVQVPHRDQDMWAGPKGDIEYLVNVMWPISDYTRDNGATMLWPDSHKRQEDMLIAGEHSIAAEMTPGSALLFLGSTLHGAGANVSSAIRRGMIVSYCLGWLKPYENQWLSYPPHIARHFDPGLAALVGYRQHRPNLGNYDGQCPSILLKGDVSDYLHSVDELLPAQEQLIEDFYAGRLEPAD